MEPDRVAIVTTSYPAHAGDPAGHFVRAEARALAAEGHAVVVIAPGAEHARDPGIRVIGIADGGAFGWPGALARLAERPTRLIGAARFAWGARRALQRRGPFRRTIAHFLVPSGWPVAVGAARAAGRIEVVAHGSDVRLLTRLPARLRAAVVASLLRAEVSFRFVSRDSLQTLVRASSPQVAERARVEPVLLDLGTVPTRATARRGLAVGSGATLIVVVARLIPEKRVATALGAAALVPSATVVVVGDGPGRAALEAGFPSVRFLGRLARPETLAWIRAADLVLSASRDEGAPTVIREARALGVPVVAVRAGDLAEWAEADPALYVVP